MKSVEIDVSKLAKQVADDLKEYSEEYPRVSEISVTVSRFSFMSRPAASALFLF